MGWLRGLFDRPARLHLVLLTYKNILNKNKIYKLAANNFIFIFQILLKLPCYYLVTDYANRRLSSSRVSYFKIGGQNYLCAYIFRSSHKIVRLFVQRSEN